jgi:four helix bundle protein
MFGYENLSIYHKAKTLNQEILRFNETNTVLPYYIKNQMGRASLSVMLNIAEGAGRFTKNDRRHFYVMSRSSLFETSAIVDLLFSTSKISKEQNDKWIHQMEELSRMLYSLIKTLEEK